MNMRANGVSEITKILHFDILKLKTGISFNIMLVLMILCLRNIYFQVSNYIMHILLYNKCSFLLLLMVWHYV